MKKVLRSLQRGVKIGTKLAGRSAIRAISNHLYESRMAQYMDAVQGLQRERGKYIHQYDQKYSRFIQSLLRCGAEWGIDITAQRQLSPKVQVFIEQNPSFFENLLRLNLLGGMIDGMQGLPPGQRTFLLQSTNSFAMRAADEYQRGWDWGRNCYESVAKLNPDYYPDVCEARTVPTNVVDVEVVA